MVFMIDIVKMDSIESLGGASLILAPVGVSTNANFIVQRCLDS